MSANGYTHFRHTTISIELEVKVYFLHNHLAKLTQTHMVNGVFEVKDAVL